MAHRSWGVTPSQGWVVNPVINAVAARSQVPASVGERRRPKCPEQYGWRRSSARTPFGVPLADRGDLSPPSTAAQTPQRCSPWKPDAQRSAYRSRSKMRRACQPNSQIESSSEAACLPDRTQTPPRPSRWRSVRRTPALTSVLAGRFLRRFLPTARCFRSRARFRIPTLLASRIAQTESGRRRAVSTSRGNSRARRSAVEPLTVASRGRGTPWATPHRPTSGGLAGVVPAGRPRERADQPRWRRAAKLPSYTSPA